MHRALPVSNKILSKKWDESNHRIHTEKLKNMQARVKSSKPVQFDHLKIKAKKEQMLEDRFTEIERENRILLEKMSSIMNKRKSKNSGLETKSLNKNARREEMRRITIENQALLKRLQDKSPCYNSHQWEEERRKTEKRLQNMCEFPYSLGRGGSTPITFKRPRKLSPLRKIGIFSKKVELGGKIYQVEIKRNKRNLVIYIGENSCKESYSLKLGMKEALELMGNAVDYNKLVGMLDVDNGEIILVDERLEDEDEKRHKQREKHSRSGEYEKKKGKELEKMSKTVQVEKGNNVVEKKEVKKEEEEDEYSDEMDEESEQESEANRGKEEVKVKNVGWKEFEGEKDQSEEEDFGVQKSEEDVFDNDEELDAEKSEQGEEDRQNYEEFEGEYPEGSEVYVKDSSEGEDPDVKLGIEKEDENDEIDKHESADYED